MRIAKRFETSGDEPDVLLRVCEFFTRAGYRESESPPGRAAFRRNQGRGAALAWRIERCPARVEARVGRVGSSEDDGPVSERCLVLVHYQVASTFRLASRLDEIWVDLETEALRVFLETGRHDDPAARLDAVRRPVAGAILLNLAMGTLLIAGAGFLAGAGPVPVLAAAAVVGVVNTVSILGFADVLMEAMERLRR